MRGCADTAGEQVSPAAAPGDGFESQLQGTLRAKILGPWRAFWSTTTTPTSSYSFQFAKEFLKRRTTALRLAPPLTRSNLD